VRDGHTVKRRGSGRGETLADFLERHEATLVVVRGAAAGQEYALEREKLVLGRGAGADLSFDDDQMSSEHAAIEWSGGGFRVCDLGSTNGTFLNGRPVAAQDLASGDRIELGRHLLQLRLEERAREPRVYLVPDD
jgi:pSer/pThr/pTyr-binding forkhead associated (FHA) protein